jgi:hypothetical protein
MTPSKQHCTSGTSWWHKLVKVMTGLLIKQSQADPCLFFKHVNGSLNIWISWVGNLLNVSKAKVNEQEKEESLIV